MRGRLFFEQQTVGGWEPSSAELGRQCECRPASFVQGALPFSTDFKPGSLTLLVATAAVGDGLGFLSPWGERSLGARCVPLRGRSGVPGGRRGRSSRCLQSPSHPLSVEGSVPEEDRVELGAAEEQMRIGLPGEAGTSEHLDVLAGTLPVRVSGVGFGDVRE